MWKVGEFNVEKMNFQGIQSMKKMPHKKDGYALALAVVILGVALTIATLLIGLNSLQVSNSELVERKIENQILCEQIEYDFFNLSADKFKEHLKSLGATNETQGEDIYVFDDKIVVKVLNDFKKIEAMLDKYPELVNERIYDGSTPLYYAVEKNNVPLVKKLIAKNADVNYYSPFKYGNIISIPGRKLGYYNNISYNIRNKNLIIYKF